MLVNFQLTHVTNMSSQKLEIKFFIPTGVQNLFPKIGPLAKHIALRRRHRNIFKICSRKNSSWSSAQKKRKTQNTAFSVRFRKDTPFFTADGERSRTPRHRAEGVAIYKLQKGREKEGWEFATSTRPKKGEFPPTTPLSHNVTRKHIFTKCSLYNNCFTSCCWRKLFCTK